MPRTVFAYDVFLCHSPQDKVVVRRLAERLRADGLRVWFDESEIKPGDSIPARIEEGLERSRVLVLCMSANVFPSDWPTLESQTFRFRDPLNRDRRFIPLRLDDVEPGEALAQPSLCWRGDVRAADYAELLEACRSAEIQTSAEQDATCRQLEHSVLSLGHTAAVRSVALGSDGRRVLSASDDRTVRLWDLKSGRCLRVLEGHAGGVFCVAWSGDGQHSVSGSDDTTVRLWDLKGGCCLRVLEEHSGSVWGAAWSPNGQFVATGSHDRTVRLWHMESGHCVHLLEGHSRCVRSVAWSPDGCGLLSGSDDGTTRHWEVESGHCLRVFEGHTDSVRSVAWNPDGWRFLSGSYDGTMRLWDVRTGRCLRVLEKHTARIFSVAWMPDGRRALSGCEDNAVRLWDVEDGRCLRVLAGHGAIVLSVATSADGHHALSGSYDHGVRFWDVDAGQCLRAFDGHSASVWTIAWSADRRWVASGSSDNTVRLWDVDTGKCRGILEGHTSRVWSVAWSGSGRHIVSGGGDSTVRFWDVQSGRCLHVLEGHTASVKSVALSADCRQILSGSDDGTLRLWGVEDGLCVAVLEGHLGSVWSVAFSTDGQRALSGSDDKTVRLWDTATGRCIRVLKGHSDRVWTVAWSQDGQRGLSGCSDNTVRLWELETGRCLRVLEGHSGRVWSIAWSRDCRYALSGSEDKTVRLWDVDTGRCLCVLEGHSAVVHGVAFSLDGQAAFSGAENGVLRVWDLRVFNLISHGSPRSRVRPEQPPRIPEQVEYTNAKVLLVGDSGSGKTGLTGRLAQGQFTPSDSTSGTWSTQWLLRGLSSEQGLDREIWLWDFGGQADQRLVHQLYMEKTALILLLFDADREEVLPGLCEWQQALRHNVPAEARRFLVAGRTDVGFRGHRERIKRFAEENGYRYFETSAREGWGCDDLKNGILAHIPWDQIEKRTSPRIFKTIKDEILRMRDEGTVLVTFKELREILRHRLPAEASFDDATLDTVVGLLDGPGVVKELEFGTYILLRPEWINAYAQAVIRTLRSDPRELGCLPLRSIAEGKLILQTRQPDGEVKEEKRLPETDERAVLQAMEQTMLQRSLCLRQGDQLVFPSHCGRERPAVQKVPSVFVSYRFQGYLDDIYATLVVRLAHCGAFPLRELWRDAADLETLADRKRVGIKLNRDAEGHGELEVYSEHGVTAQEQVILADYIHEHLQTKASDVLRLRHYLCPHCGTPVSNREVAMERLAAQGEAANILCVKCERRVALWDEMEQRFASPEVRQQVRSLQAAEATELDDRRKAGLLVAEVSARIRSADQKCLEIPGCEDEGVDMEVEFTDDNGEGTGQRIYLQLKAGNSYLRRRKTDGAEVYRIKKQRWVKYWLSQPGLVMLVIGTFPEDDDRRRGGTEIRFVDVRWMEIRDWLRQATDNGRKKVTQIVFQGERLDLTSVRRWRDRVLSSGTNPPR